ncbi:MAG TPA: hypothetical protein VLL27_00020 [Solirubrobacterales bacterium]|jgi:hypothetical protein|nr:hypothetical protein [Solirubrobacterales bacterium]
MYRGAVQVFSLIMLAIGLAVLVVTFANGGGPASVGFLLGLAFVVVGAGRLYLNARMGR